MKKLVILLGCLALILAFTAPIMAGNGKGKQDCTAIQDGVLTSELLT